MKTNFVVMAFLCSVAGAVYSANTKVAEPATAAAKSDDTKKSGYFEQLDELRSKNALLTETLKNADLTKRISEIANGSPNSSSGAGFNAVPPAQVQMVSGLGANLTALVSLANGSKVNARVGGTIPGLGVVKSISIDEVIVSNKAQNISLPFATDSAGATTGGVSYPSSQQMSPMPPVMMPGIR